MVLERNFLDVYPYENWSDHFLPPFEVGETFIPTENTMTESKTTPPNFLTEADLIGLMDKNGIGIFFCFFQKKKKKLKNIQKLIKERMQQFMNISKKLLNVNMQKMNLDILFLQLLELL